jgi:hypothetical protein
MASRGITILRLTAGRSIAATESSHRREGEGMMPTETQSSNSTSEASPGQSDKRDQLLRIYDELDDVQKQELLRLAMVLLRRK